MLSSASVDKLNVLFCSAGRRVELLKAFRSAYQTLALKGSIIALDIDPMAPALQVADRAYIVPRLDDSAFIPTLIEICRREEVGLVFPLTDWDIPILSERRKEIEQTGARVAVVSPDAAKTAADKWLTMKLFQRLGLCTPKSWLPSDLDPDRMEYPLFIKPRKGSAAKETFKVGNRRELAFFLEYVHDPVVQEYLPGLEITSDVICDLEGRLLGVVCRQRIEVRWGEVAKGVTVNNQEIIQACGHIARELRAVGAITVQCLLKGGQPCYTEINARLAGGIPLGIQAGVDAPLWLLARTAGVHVDIPPLGTYKSGIYMTRFDDSYFLNEADYAQLAGHRL
jgi:carbamoyl-phosphate synthase large subunit